jgi:hypothetical protein
MSDTTQPFFIVSSGRSGTAMLHKVLSAEADVEMHHEYMVNLIQPLAVKRYLDLVPTGEAMRILNESYGAAVRYSDAKLWGDSSNKASWLIPELAAILPNAKFIHLIRDGRKVASSYFHKLGDECYDDRSAAILQAHYDGQMLAPPPEKKYWWPVPKRESLYAPLFRKYNQFQRISWHWAEVNRSITDSLAALPKTRSHVVRLEDLYSSPSAVQGLYGFLNLRYRDACFAAFARPHNVNRPEDKPLDARQRMQFEAIACDAMEDYGYANTEEYVVNY